MGGPTPRYEAELIEVVSAMAEDNWHESVRLGSPDLFKVREELTLREGLIFYQETKFVPEQGKCKEILEAGHGLHIGRTRTKKRIQEVFW